MNEIELKIKELADLLENVPEECKGDSLTANYNSSKFVATRLAIHALQYKLSELETSYTHMKSIEQVKH